MAKVAITGATGLLGGNLAAESLARSHEVVATYRPTSDRRHLDGLDLRWAPANLADEAALVRAFAGAEVVFHSAAATSLRARPTPALVRANVEGTATVLRAARAAGVGRIVHVSSTAAVGVSEDGRPCTEAHPFNLEAHGLLDGYAATKRAAEDLARDAAAEGQDVVIVNPGFLFGPYDAKPSSGRMILQIAAGHGWLAAPGANCFVGARDVARGAWAAAEHGVAGERYILGGENWTYAEAFRRIAAIVGRPPPWLAAPRPIAAGMGLVGDLVEAVTGRDQPITSQTVRWGYARGFVFDSGRAARELGWRAGPPEDAIREAWRWFSRPA